MIILHIIEQSLAFLPFAFGVFISYVILNKADLTVDGSFVLGAAVYGLTILSGGTPPVAMFLAMVSGFMAGGSVALLQYRDRMAPLISGILALFILQSINLALMGRPNLNLLGQPSLLKMFESNVGSHLSTVVSIGAISLLLFVVLTLLMCSRIGLLLRAFGDNSTLMSLMGHRPETVRFVGLGLSNSFVALSGTLTTQYQGYVDIGMGTGNVLIGIGTVIIGQQSIGYLMHERHIPVALKLVSCIFGVIVYFTVVNCLVAFGVNPIYLKLAIGSVIAALLLCHQSQPVLGGVR